MSEIADRPGSLLKGTQLLSDSFQTFLAKLPAFLTINLVCLSPAGVLYVFMMNSATNENQILTALLTYTGFEMFLGFIACGATVYATVEYLAGHELTVGDALVKGLKLLPMVLGVSIVSILWIMGASILLIIPGIIMSLSLYVAIPIAVTEDLGIMDSLRRSRELMYGSRAELFVAIFILFIVQAVANSGIEMATKGQGAVVVASTRIAIGVIFTTISSIMASIAYVQLREAVDDIDAEELSKVFG